MTTCNSDPIQKVITFPAKPATNQDTNIANIPITNNMNIQAQTYQQARQRLILWSYK